MVILVRWKAPEIQQVYYQHIQSPPPSALSCGFCMLDLFMAVSSMQGGTVLHRLHPSLSATPFPGRGTVLTPIFLQHVIGILSTFQCLSFFNIPTQTIFSWQAHFQCALQRWTKQFIYLILHLMWLLWLPVSHRLKFQGITASHGTSLLFSTDRVCGLNLMYVRLMLY